MRKRIFFLFIIMVQFGFAQIEPGLLFGLTEANTTEIQSLAGMTEGQMLYNSTTKEVMIYDGSQWVSTSNANWLSSGNILSTGAYLGSNNDIALQLTSNGINLLQLGRRQTLGLVQNYQDYNDPNQYITHLTGSSGTSVLQFEASAASFYKPMFFTDTDGNFRLKGSAASTDFFEIGSSGVNNAGEVEFIIGDDGAEPFIFKRYDYRDQLKKELFRIQGSSDNQNALTRVGVGTGRLANSTLEVNGSIASAITQTNNNIILGESNHTLIVSSNSTVTLPSANSCMGRFYIIKNQHNSAIGISGYIDGSGTTANNIPPNSVLKLQSDGTAWQSLTSFGTRAKTFQTFDGRAYFYNNNWYAPNNQYGVSFQHWNQHKGTGSSPTYSSTDQAGVPIPSNMILSKFVMKNDFNANVSGTQQINLSVLRGTNFITIGTYSLNGLSTNVSISSQQVDFVLQENDLLVWACTTIGGASRLSYASLTFEFTY